MRYPIAVTLFLVGCGGYQPPETPYHCSTILGSIDSNHLVYSPLLPENATLAYYTLQSAAPRFRDAAKNIESVVIRDTWVWNVQIGDFMSPVSGSTYEHKFIEINRDMYSLDHELGHLWFYHSTGDSDQNHIHWFESGQGGRPFGSP